MSQTDISVNFSVSESELPFLFLYYVVEYNVTAIAHDLPWTERENGTEDPIIPFIILDKSTLRALQVILQFHNYGNKQERKTLEYIPFVIEFMITPQ